MFSNQLFGERDLPALALVAASAGAAVAMARRLAAATRANEKRILNFFLGGGVVVGLGLILKDCALRRLLRVDCSWCFEVKEESYPEEKLRTFIYLNLQYWIPQSASKSESLDHRVL